MRRSLELLSRREVSTVSSKVLLHRRCRWRRCRCWWSPARRRPAPAGYRPSSRRWSTRSGRRRARGAPATAGIEYGTVGGVARCVRWPPARSRSAARSPASGTSSCDTPTVAGRRTAGSPSTRCAPATSVAAGSDRRHDRRPILHFGLRDGDSTSTRRRSSGASSGVADWCPTDGTAARAAPPPRLRCGDAETPGRSAIRADRTMPG